MKIWFLVVILVLTALLVKISLQIATISIIIQKMKILLIWCAQPLLHFSWFCFIEQSSLYFIIRGWKQSTFVLHMLSVTCVSSWPKCPYVSLAVALLNDLIHCGVSFVRSYLIGRQCRRDSLVHVYVDSRHLSVASTGDLVVLKLLVSRRHVHL